jgi:hypothetical protein
VLILNCGKRAPVGTIVSIRRPKCIRILFSRLTFEKNTMSDETAWTEKMFGVKWKWRSVSTAVAGWFFCKLRRHEIKAFEQNITSQTLVRHARPWSGILYRTRTWIVRAYDYPKSKLLNKISLHRRCERYFVSYTDRACVRLSEIEDFEQYIASQTLRGVFCIIRIVRAYDYPKLKILNKISLHKRCERPWSGILLRTRCVCAYNYLKQKQRQKNVTI